MTVGLGEKDALMLNERVEATVEDAAEHGWINTLMNLGFEEC